jgi:16S rRNA (cytosine967-C5)-methyltransferase
MVKLHRHLVAAVQAGLEEIFTLSTPADRVVAQALQGHPKWGSRDRRQFAEQVYEIVRHHRWACHLAGDTALPKVWAAWWMFRQQEQLAEEFAGELTLEIVNQRAAEDVALGVKESFPDWLASAGETAYGEAWPQLAHALNQPAHVYVRANRLLASVEEVRQNLQEEGVETVVVVGADDALQLESRRPLQNSGTWRMGWCEIQDAGSQQIAPFLKISPGQVVIDGCAGAGGKALHLAALMRNQGRLIALDVVPNKLRELETRARRNGVLITETHLLDEQWSQICQFQARADRVLLDVPCSGTGVLRRKPDTKWRLTEVEVGRLVALQGRILNAYSAMVKPGGKLVYATCSILPQENEAQVAAFLTQQNGAWRLDEERWVRPDVAGWDGFYMARLQRGGS